MRSTSIFEALKPVRQRPNDPLATIASPVTPNPAWPAAGHCGIQKTIHALFPQLGTHCSWTSLSHHPSPLYSKHFGVAFLPPPSSFSALFFSIALIITQYFIHIAHLFYCLFFSSRMWAPWRHEWRYAAYSWYNKKKTTNWVAYIARMYYPPELEARILKSRCWQVGFLLWAVTENLFKPLS